MGAVLLRHDRPRQRLHARPERARFLDPLVLTMDDGRRSARQVCWLHGLGDMCTFICATSIPAIKTAIAIKTATAVTASALAFTASALALTASALALTTAAALAATALPVSITAASAPFTTAAFAITAAAPGAAAALALKSRGSRTPLANAIQRKHAACVAMLRAHGAPE